MKVHCFAAFAIPDIYARMPAELYAGMYFIGYGKHFYIKFKFYVVFLEKIVYNGDNYV